MAAVVDLTRVMTEHSSSIAAEVAPANASVWTRIMPRLWLNPSFKFPVRYECMMVLCVYGGVWWCMVVYGGVWWCICVYSGVW